MPDFTIQTTYRLPVFRRRTCETETLEDACNAAIADDDWDDAKRDYEASGEIHVTGIWRRHTPGTSGQAVRIESQFDEDVQRRARHFEILLGVLKILADDADAARSPSPDWLARANLAITRGKAILAGQPDPDGSANLPVRSHVLARLHESRVRDAVAAILDIDPDFAGMLCDQVTDDDIHSACLDTLAALNFSDEIGSAEFRSAMTALKAALRRQSHE